MNSVDTCILTTINQISGLIMLWYGNNLFDITEIHNTLL